MSKKADNLNDAIVSKIDKILKSTDNIVDLYITIEGSREETPSITYKITEFICPAVEGSDEE